MSTPTIALPIRIEFARALAAQIGRLRGPHRAEAARLLKLVRLYRHLVAEADAADGQLAAGLAASLLPAIEVAAGRLRLDC